MLRLIRQPLDRSSLELFQKDVASGLGGWAAPDRLEALVGIPFHDEDDTLPDVVRTALDGLEAAGLSERSAVLLVGSQAGARALELALELRHRVGPSRLGGFLLGPGLEGRGWAVRALLVAARTTKAPLVLLHPDLVPQPGGEVPGQGFGPGWIRRLLAPVVELGRDLALARFDRDPLDHAVERLLAAPVIAGAHGIRIAQPMPGVAALSLRMIRKCLDDTDDWSRETGTYGVDLWLTLRALAEEVPLCEVPLGVTSFGHEVGHIKTVFRQVAHVLFQQIQSEECCRELSPLIRTVEAVGTGHDVLPPPRRIEPEDLLLRFKLEFDHFDSTLFRQVVSDEFRERLAHLVDRAPDRLAINDEEWAATLRDFISAYLFNPNFHPDDVIDGLFPFFLARLLAQVVDTRRLEQRLAPSTELSPALSRELALRRLDHQLSRLDDRVIELWPTLAERWQRQQEEGGSYLPRLSSWEFVPNVDLTVPQELERVGGGPPVQAPNVYKRLLKRYRESFLAFLTDELHLDHLAASDVVLAEVATFMKRLEGAFEALFPGDISTSEGATALLGAVLDRAGTAPAFQLTERAARQVLQREPPQHLATYLGVPTLGGVLSRLDARDALAAASWTDRMPYLERVLELIAREATPDWFEVGPVRPVAIDAPRLGALDEVHGSGALPRLAGRVIGGSLLKGWGGDYPRTWFVLLALKRSAGLELFSRIWQDIAAEGRRVGPRIVATIRGEWGRRVLSAHNAFENEQQRIVARRLAELAEAVRGEPSCEEAARVLAAAAKVYHLSITLPDGTFVPLSAWTWAAFADRGGVGAPTPLSSLVERDWATRDFLTEYISDAGRGDDETVRRTVLELVAEGRASEDLGSHLLDVTADWEDFTVLQAPGGPPPKAGELTRPVLGPILEPIRSHAWESRYVLNPGAVRLDGTVYLLYRAFGEDRVSRIGLAWSRDGVHIDGRLDRPVYSPAHRSEAAGCEDPRVTVIGDRLYMLYTAYGDDLPQIAMASIPVNAFLARRFDAWTRHGLGFPGLPNKDAVLYPETFGGRHVIYHRIDPSMWITFIDRLDCPWPRTGQKVFLGPRPGMMWDGVKIGAGATPIKTTRGWLNIYHGVDFDQWYRLGVLFMDLEDPTRVLYQSLNPILKPETEFELGRPGADEYWVPHVVFTCGAVPAEDKDVIDLDDEILVYYGAADTAIGVAKGRLRDLVPILG